MWLRQFDRGDHSAKVAATGSLAQCGSEKAACKHVVGPSAIEIVPQAKTPDLRLVINNVK
jgi:hypothetical protein